MLLRIREQVMLLWFTDYEAGHRIASWQPLREKVLTRVGQRYADFGPTLAAEHLAKDGFRVIGRPCGRG